MILQALKEYYDRKAADPSSQIAPPGFEWKEIPYIVVLNKEGHVVALESTFEGEGKKRRAKSVLVPQSVKRSGSGVASNLLWDNPEYTLGIMQTAKQRSANKSLEEQSKRVAKQHADFARRVTELALEREPAIRALARFLANDDKEAELRCFGADLDQMLETGLNVTFRLAGQAVTLPELPEVRAALTDAGGTDGKTGLCLVSGESDVIERLHPSIKGVSGAQSTGANIVSFNLDAFRSFNRKQGDNSPIGKRAAFAYTTALNHLLSRDSRQKMLVGDASTIFWASKSEDAELEKQFASFFGEPPKDDPDRGVEAVRALYQAIQSGALDAPDTNRRFHVLGLGPNASRISIRFWISDTVSAMAHRMVQHFEDLRIAHGPKEKEVLSVFRVLVSTAVLGKSENVPPNLAGDTMRTILEGQPYPRTLLLAAVRRNRAEQDVTYARAALIKACINRNSRYKNPIIKEELKMALDTENTNIGYRLGRLFAVLEKIQAEANPGLNATIRDRYYGAASGSPVSVFGTLMKLKNHHVAKLSSHGSRIHYERILGEILTAVDDFPPYLPLDDQGRFAIGYYHQTQDFYTKKSDKAPTQGQDQ